MAGLTYLLDTNILSEAVKPTPNRSVMELIKKHGKVTCTASLVIHEMYYGMHKLDSGRIKHNLQRYLRILKEQSLVALSYDQDAAKWHAQERARLAAIGKTPAFVGGQIAAISQPHFVAADSANIADDSWVLGVVIDGQARAYSLNLLNSHEVVNDRIGNTAFAAVW